MKKKKNTSGKKGSGRAEKNGRASEGRRPSRKKASAVDFVGGPGEWVVITGGESSIFDRPRRR